MTLAREAMATRFELVLPGTPSASLRAAGEEALDEIERFEGLLSLYRPDSEIARVNARAGHEAVPVSPPVFQLLQLAKRIHEETEGAFDVTVGPLIRCWGFMGGRGRKPTKAEVKAARAKVGLQHVELDAKNRTVRFDREGMIIDLGAIGKGFAIEQAAARLLENEIGSALLHGGTSSVYAIGRPPDQAAWRVAIELPALATGREALPLAVVALRDESLSVSAVWGKYFESGGQRFGHILDPRTGAPAQGAVLAAIVMASATEADALTTPLLIEGVAGHGRMARLRPGMKSLVVSPGEGGGFIASRQNLELATEGLAGARVTVVEAAP